ncbi:MAG: radical SAM/SPASM domain-containing protein [Puniceicoccales bacterium]
MGYLSKLSRIGPKLIGYKLAKHRLAKVPMPINFTYSITHACQSLCKTCNIGLLYRENPKLTQDELKLDEIEKIFKSIGPGHIYFFNISGGEPFLRKEIPEIVRLALRYLKPAIIHSPTNALMPDIIAQRVEAIMGIIEEEAPGTHFTIKPSFDAVGEKHDVIRGVKGNFDRLLKTIEKLKDVQKRHPNLYIGLGTVISNFSIDHLPETAEYVRKLNVDSYISEIAEQRSEMSNTDDPITPSAERYAEAIQYFKNETRKELKNKPLLSRLTMSMRLVYYDLVVQILKKEKQVIPCYGGITNAHMNSYGDIWPCAILAYSKNMGNLRDFDYDFRKLWQDHVTSAEVRKYIHERKCHCPLANQSYSNILMSPKSMLKSIRHILFN